MSQDYVFNKIHVQIEGDKAKFFTYTWGRCRDVYVDVVYPLRVDLRRLARSNTRYQFEYADLVTECYDSNKNINRYITVIPKTAVVVRVHGSVSCSHSVDELVLLEPGKPPRLIEKLSETREVVNGKYRILRQVEYIVVNNEKIVISERDIEKTKIKLEAKISEKDGKIYVTGDTYDIKEELKSHGFKWDPVLKAWWTDKLSREEVASLLRELNVEVT